MNVADDDLDRILHATLFGEALTGAAVPALLADDRGYYVAANDQVCKLTGYTRRHLTALRAGELSGDERSRGLYEHFQQGRKLHGRKLVRCADGHTIGCRYSAVPTVVSKLPYFVVLLWPLVAQGH